MLCRYWGLNDPFRCVPLLIPVAAYTAAETFDAFAWAVQTPKIAPSRGGP